MKYYCKNCGITIDLSEKIFVRFFGDSQTPAVLLRERRMCPLCQHKTAEKIPDYETPERYEKRTGEPWPDNAPVWVIDGGKGTTSVTLFGNYRNIRQQILDAGNTISSHTVVCVQSPVPPPDGWKPGDVKE